LVAAAVRKLTREEEVAIDLQRLQGSLHDFFRIRTGDIRIVFSVQYGLVHIASISQIDVHGNVYK
jgi:mRNA-degrading endonuclease RelE of RelBE toxin-antitoxin system